MRRYLGRALRWLGDRAVSRGLLRWHFPSVRVLSAAELERRLRGPAPQPLLLDVRTAEEFAVSHLCGALHTPDRASALRALEGVPRDREIVVYCAVGWRSAELAEQLLALGFTRVRNLEGSLFRWANQGRPLFRGSEPVTQVHPFDARWGRLLEPRRRAFVAGSPGPPSTD